MTRRRRSGAFWTAVVVAVLGAVILPMYGVLAVFRSDVCDPESTAYYCSGDGQMTGLVVAVAAGPGALLVVGLFGVLSRWAAPRRCWPLYVLAVQLAGFVAVTSISSKVG